MKIPHWYLIALVAALGGSSCGDDTGPHGGPGTLELATTTTGIQPDDDGYAIMVDGTARGTIGPNDTVTLSDVGAGSHSVELAQISFNCATLGAFTRSVTISETASDTVDYSVACDAESRSRIAYTALNAAGTDYEVIVANADGSDPVSLTDLIGAIIYRFKIGIPRAVAWSGDGARMAFTRSDSALYVANSDGTWITQVAPVGGAPVWTRDGQTVAFLAREDPNGDNLFVAKPGVAGPSRVTDISGLFAYDFSAGGGILAYEQGTTSHAFTIREDGTGTTPIAPAGICCLQRPTLSPDGTLVAYHASPQTGDLGLDVFVSPSDGSGTPLDLSNLPADDAFPVWSPDGSRIAFVNSPGGLFDRGSLYVVNIDGSNLQNLTPVDVASEPSWSPDGTRIAYTGYATGSGHIYVANADGSGRVDITPTATEALMPTWTGR